MPDDKSERTVGVSDMPKTIKGYQWFEALSGSRIKIEGVSLLGNNKGATRYAALVVCGSRDQAKDFVKKVKDKNEGPRAKLLSDDKSVEEFRADMVKNKGWSSDAPDGDKAINANTGLDMRGDSSGFTHGFNPYKRSPSRRPSRRRSPSRSRGSRRPQPQPLLRPPPRPRASAKHGGALSSGTATRRVRASVQDLRWMRPVRRGPAGRRAGLAALL
ncbi:unnamed protein product [Prorocentrum cordatum]|uniref:Uncharacterized protein n=1 Tax=Prorocentrum cordatum TaxID=2364126 RepID=A0ABN9Y2Y5_9DINO|nr:unnamed protein product [Polarella glacialis]